MEETPHDWPSRQTATAVDSLSVTASSYFFPLNKNTAARPTTINATLFLII